MKLLMRAFLHDISTPLAVVEGAISVVLMDLEKNAELHKEQIIKLKKAVDSLDKIRIMLHEMRNKLHE